MKNKEHVDGYTEVVANFIDEADREKEMQQPLLANQDNDIIDENQFIEKNMRELEEEKERGFKQQSHQGKWNS